MSTTATAPAPVTPEERQQAVDAAVADFTSKGWRVENRSDSQAVFVKGHRPNHVLHLILSLVTLGLWVPVWVVVSVVSGEKRRVVTVDEFGRRSGR